MDENPYQTPADSLASETNPSLFLRFPRLFNWLASLATLIPLTAIAFYFAPKTMSSEVRIHMPFLPSNKSSPSDAIDLYNHNFFMSPYTFVLLLVLWFAVPLILVNLAIFTYRRWSIGSQTK